MQIIYQIMAAAFSNLLQNRFHLARWIYVINYRSLSLFLGNKRFLPPLTWAGDCSWRYAREGRHDASAGSAYLPRQMTPGLHLLASVWKKRMVLASNWVQQCCFKKGWASWVTCAKCLSPAPNLKSCAPNAVVVSSDCHKLRLEYPQRGFGFWSWLLADQGNRSWSLPGRCARSIGKGIMHRGRLGGQWGPSWETRIVACIHICPHAIAILQA